MSAEFVVFDKSGRGVDWVDPYVSHVDNGDGTFEVDNGYFTYHVEVPEGGRFAIRALES